MASLTLRVYQLRTTINKLYFILKRVVYRIVGVFRNGGGLGTGELYIPAVFFDPLLHRSPCFPDVDNNLFLHRS